MSSLPAHPSVSTIMVKFPNGLLFLSEAARTNERVQALITEVTTSKTETTPNATEGPFTNAGKATIVKDNMQRLDYLTAFDVSDITSPSTLNVQTMTYYLDLRVQILQRILEAQIFRETLSVLAVLRQSLYYAIQARAMLDLCMLVPPASTTRH